ncbi:hypothetical protein B4096_0860 [Heyndrickxia coagulans]|jgi:hypothetical protein|uniref:Uncharacterized protein n=1 Tax=Heyndrickxia coagulans TaxID=1398 RepID=A0A150KJF0_HEYCO|nr:hypothetical protein B4100_0927 [Heyndrickxia coagulans]KYC65107.1 hypothetical protein B4098_0817 [Heyndrickxia coagulans]KYC73328.1 hypothetical protein B4099_0954 [Heyndrickxia coagulans]KYC77220.1 hypothetical protein B4096_0860 [Heyndrickxia coagulans]
MAWNVKKLALGDAVVYKKFLNWIGGEMACQTPGSGPN